MADMESAFEQLLGRKASEKEIQSLYRVKNALKIRDNDALWVMLMALESYDTLYRKYPTMIAEQVKHIVDDQRLLMASIADAETKKALGSLADAVSKTSASIAVRLAEASRWLSWGWAWVTFTGFGVLCVFVGYVLGSGRMPWWAGASANQPPLAAIFGALARTPAGWVAATGATAATLTAAWRAREDLKQGRRPELLLGALALSVLSAVFLWPAL